MNGRTKINGGTTDQHDERDHECYNNKAISYVKVIIEKNISWTVKKTMGKNTGLLLESIFQTRIWKVCNDVF